MTYVIFQNKGVIDKTSVTTLGVNSKENENPIGYFGTGLKYAIAICLRNNISIDIYAGANKWHFDTIAEQIRKDTFNIVTLNNVKLGFTTELGKTWSVEQAFRELYCNTIDEGGTVTVSNTIPARLSGNTTILVKGEEFLEAYYNRENIILSSTPIYRTGKCEIHERPSDYIYYRGIQAYKLPQKSKYTYNILCKQELTEDRTFKHSYNLSWIISSCIEECNNTDILQNVLVHSNGYYEESLSYEYGSEVNQKFVDFYLANRLTINPKLQYSIILRLKKCLPDISDLYEEHTLTNIERITLNKSIQFLSSLNLTTSEFQIKVVTQLESNALGMAKNNTIYIAQRTFMMGTKMVAGTILEEYLHLKHNLYDESRSMQNYLFDLVISLGERVIGEPL